MEVQITQPVQVALRNLGEDDRRRVTAWFDHLRNWENDEFVRSHSKALSSPAGAYVLQTTTDIRVFFTIHDGTAIILDIARKASLEGFGHAEALGLEGTIGTVEGRA